MSLTYRILSNFSIIPNRVSAGLNNSKQQSYLSLNIARYRLDKFVDGSILSSFTEHLGEVAPRVSLPGKHFAQQIHIAF